MQLKILESSFVLQKNIKTNILAKFLYPYFSINVLLYLFWLIPTGSISKHFDTNSGSAIDVRLVLICRHQSLLHLPSRALTASIGIESSIYVIGTISTCVYFRLSPVWHLAIEAFCFSLIMYFWQTNSLVIVIWIEANCISPFCILGLLVLRHLTLRANSLVNLLFRYMRSLASHFYVS